MKFQGALAKKTREGRIAKPITPPAFLGVYRNHEVHSAAAVYFRGTSEDDIYVQAVTGCGFINIQYLLFKGGSLGRRCIMVV